MKNRSHISLYINIIYHIHVFCGLHRLRRSPRFTRFATSDDYYGITGFEIAKQKIKSRNQNIEELKK